VKRKTLNPVVSPEIPVGWPRPWQGMTGNRDRFDKDESLTPPRGRRRHRATQRCRSNQAGQRSSWFGEERAEYGKATLSGSLKEGNWLGMRAGIAKKSGNADGAKAFTAIDRDRTNICYTRR